MNASMLFSDCAEYLLIVGKAKNILIDTYDDELGLMVLKNTKGRKVTLKLKKSSNSIDVSIYTRPYKNDNVEVLHPYRKNVRGNLNALMGIVEEAFKELDILVWLCV